MYILLNSSEKYQIVFIDYLMKIYKEYSSDLLEDIFVIALKYGINPEMRARKFFSIFRQVTKIEVNDPRFKGEKDFLDTYLFYIKDDMRGMLLAGYMDNLHDRAVNENDRYAKKAYREISFLWDEYLKLTEGSLTPWAIAYMQATNKRISDTSLHLYSKNWNESD